MKLSVLDQAPITNGNTAVEALRKSEELAILADELGYSRFWLAEHHGTDGYASSAPEIVVAHIASKTKRIRVGTGGIMMMHYSPLKMAEIFKTLSAFSPDRIDFGVGRAPGGDRNAMYALSEGRQPLLDNLYEKLDTTLKLINDKTPNDRLYDKTIATPSDVNLPQAWLLGSSGSSALEAARMGLGYSFAQFFMGGMTKEIMDQYKNHFVPSYFMEKPEISVAYLVTVAETKEEAEFEALPQDIGRLWLMQGKPSNLLSPEEARQYPLTESDKRMIADNRQLHLVGTAKEVADRLKEEQEYYGFDEAMICSIPHSQEKRLDVYRLLAKELL